MIIPFTFLLAFLYIAAKNFRLTMPPQKHGILYWIIAAVAMAAAIFLVALLFTAVGTLT